MMFLEHTKQIVAFWFSFVYSFAIMKAENRPPLIRTTTFEVSNIQLGSQLTILKTAQASSNIQCTVLCFENRLCAATKYEKGTKYCDLLLASVSPAALPPSAVSFSVVPEIPTCELADPTVKEGYMETAGRVNYVCDKGWIVIQNRERPHVNFSQNYQAYTAGFGDILGDFWWGLEFLYILTSRRPYKLRVEMEKISNGNFFYQEYSSFQVSAAADGYRLSVSGSTGTAGDGLAVHNGWQFSAYDRECDIHPSANCASYFQSGWWYHNCYNYTGGNPNGIPQRCPSGTRVCAVWLPLEPTTHIGMRKMRMMMQ